MCRFLCLVTAAFVTLPLLVFADSDVSKKPAKRSNAAAKRVESSKASRAKKSSAKPVPSITSEQESTAIAHVKKHHDDLLEVLIYLEENVPREYARAIRDLSRASERLALLKKRDPTRYKIELRLWQAQSRRQLLTARLQMGQDEGLLKELRETLAKEHELGLAVLQHERERLAARVAKIDEQLKKQKGAGQAIVEKKFAAVTNAAKSARRNVSSKKRKSADNKRAKDPT